MKAFFSDIFYPSDSETLADLTRFSLEGKTYPAVIIPHAGLSFVSEEIKKGFSHLRPAGRYVFIAPLHNGTFPDSDECLFTLSDDVFTTPCGNVRIKQAPGVKVEDSIREEEYSLELTLPFIAQEETPEVIPVFTALTAASQVKKLRCLIERLSDGNTSFIISGNVAAEGKPEKMKEQADRLESLISESAPLLEEAKKGNVSGCAVHIVSAFRGIYSAYTPIMEGTNPMHRTGAFA